MCKAGISCSCKYKQAKMSLSKLCQIKASFAGSSFRRFSLWLEFSWRLLRRIMAASRMMLPQTGENKHVFLVRSLDFNLI